MGFWLLWDWFSWDDVWFYWLLHHAPLNVEQLFCLPWFLRSFWLLNSALLFLNKSMATLFVEFANVLLIWNIHLCHDKVVFLLTGCVGAEGDVAESFLIFAIGNHWLICPPLNSEWRPFEDLSIEGLIEVRSISSPDEFFCDVGVESTLLSSNGLLHYAANYDITKSSNKVIYLIWMSHSQLTIMLI